MHELDARVLFEMLALPVQPQNFPDILHEMTAAWGIIGLAIVLAMGFVTLRIWFWCVLLTLRGITRGLNGLAELMDRVRIRPKDETEVAFLLRLLCKENHYGIERSDILNTLRLLNDGQYERLADLLEDTPLIRVGKDRYVTPGDSGGAVSIRTTEDGLAITYSGESRGLSTGGSHASYGPSSSTERPPYPTEMVSVNICSHCGEVVDDENDGENCASCERDATNEARAALSGLFIEAEPTLDDRDLMRLALIGLASEKTALSRELFEYANHPSERRTRELRASSSWGSDLSRRAAAAFTAPANTRHVRIAAFVHDVIDDADRETCNDMTEVLNS